MKIVLATRNLNKLRELKALAGGVLQFELMPDNMDVPETGRTFVENATIKARAASVATGLHALADDSGLVVKALGGRPGVNSARYCSGTDADRRAKLLQELANIPWVKREAAFVCSMVLCNAAGKVIKSVTRQWLGHVGFKEQGANGFGYDSIFWISGKDVTAAELTREEKNQLSHRGQAFREMMEFLTSYNDAESY